MTIEEAIEHCEEVAEKNDKIADTFDYSLKTKADCKECANEHRQLAEWLRELRMWRNYGKRNKDKLPEDMKLLKWNEEVNADE